MAKKKDFSNIVDESFAEGYTSEPEVDPRPQPEASAEPATRERGAAAKPLTDNEILLQKIQSGDYEALSAIWAHEGRFTMFLSDILRACVDIMAYEEHCTKTQIIDTALNQFFSEDVKAAAKERVVAAAIKDLEKKIKEDAEGIKADID